MRYEDLDGLSSHLPESQSEDAWPEGHTSRLVETAKINQATQRR
jgi:hypothetical protein